MSLNQVYGNFSHPYYIYAPRWIDSSAGIKALHFLCHALNQSGQKAYLVMTEAPHQGKPRVNPWLLTPVLTQEVSDAYFAAGITPIIVYSETVPGNPLLATCIVRYLMNFAGALGGASTFDEDELIISFSKKIAEDYSLQNQVSEPFVLFLPPIDPREFSKSELKEDFQVVYAGKYRSFVGKPPKVGELRSIEIFRDGPKMQSREQVKGILGKASILYSFENSSIVTEAILSGTPARFVPNVFLGEIIAEVELGNGGIVQGDSSEDLISAQESIDQGISAYYSRIDDFLVELTKFVTMSQGYASTQGYLHVIQVPVHGNVISKHRLGLAWQILQNQGIKTLFRVAYHFALRRLSWRYWIVKENT